MNASPHPLRRMLTLEEVWAGSTAFEHKVKVSLMHVATQQNHLRVLMERYMPLYDQLIADVQKNSSLSQSIVDGLAANHKLLTDALAQVPASTDTSALQQALADIEANNQKMAAAIVANTPAQGSTPASGTVQNDGPTDAQSNNTGGLVPPTQGTSTAGITNPGPDQAPASTPVDAPTGTSATNPIGQTGTSATNPTPGAPGAGGTVPDATKTP